MLAWLYNILIGRFCKHDYVELDCMEKYTIKGLNEKVCIGKTYVYKCSKCCDIKKASINVHDL